VSGGALSGSTGDKFFVSGGGGTINWNGTIGSAANHSVNISNRTGGAITFGALITDSGTGVLCDNNDVGGTGTVTFNGGLSINTGTNAGFTATNGGVVNATQNNTSIVNTIATTTGTALNVASTTIGGSGLTFRSISANGAANGIVLNNSGSSGLLTVTGNSSGGCGGVVTTHAVGTAATVTIPVSGDCTGGTIKTAPSQEPLSRMPTEFR
jgi:hypothetical protein